MSSMHVSTNTLMVSLLVAKIVCVPREYQ